MKSVSNSVLWLKKITKCFYFSFAEENNDNSLHYYPNPSALCNFWRDIWMKTVEMPSGGFSTAS